MCLHQGFFGEWSECRLENDPRFLQRVEHARRSLKAGRGIRLEQARKDRGGLARLLRSLGELPLKPFGKKLLEERLVRDVSLVREDL